MRQLQGDPATGNVHSLGHPGQFGDDVIGVGAALKRATLTDRINIGGLHPQQAHLAAGPRHEIVDIALRHHAVGGAQVLLHRSHQHTIGQSQPANIERIEKAGVGCLFNELASAGRHRR